MVTLTSSACARTPRGRSRAAARIKLRKKVLVIGKIPSAGQRRVDDGELLVALLEVDAGNAEHAAKLGVFDLHRAGRGGGARRRLRERGRAGGVEGNAALDLLHDLVDVAVEHGHRAEALDELERTR